MFLKIWIGQEWVDWPVSQRGYLRKGIKEHESMMEDRLMHIRVKSYTSVERDTPDRNDLARYVFNVEVMEYLT